MLTAEEQGKILEDEDKRLGRDWKKKRRKTIMEQLESMGGFGKDPDGEQAIREELNRTDTRPPLQYPQDSDPECEVSFGESYFWESRKRLFHGWLFQARRPSPWMEEKDLPLFYRFALHRPIMDEQTFRTIMQDMNLRLETCTGNARQPYTRPHERSRQMMLGIDVNEDTDMHPSHRFRDLLPSGGAEDRGRARKKATTMALQDPEDTHELVQSQLWSVYEHVKNGSVPIKMAAWHYRDAFDTQDMSDETLITYLEQFGVPTHHIPTNNPKARRDPPRSPTCGVAKSCGDDGKVKEGITDLTNYVGLYRSASLQIDEVVPMIQDYLVGLASLEAGLIENTLTDLDIDEETTALILWEVACENNDALVSSSSSEVKKQESHEDRLHVNESKSHGGSTTKDIDYQVGIKENEPNHLEASSTEQPITFPLATLQAKLPTCGLVDELESRMLPPARSSSKLTSLTRPTGTSESQVGQKIDGELPLDQASARRGLPSPEEVMTTGIWGLPMPIKDARKIAHAMKLPWSTIDEQVRPISAPRPGRRASHAKTDITFPKSKRKASIALHRDSRSSSKHSDHLDLFAMEDEDQETFVLSHFDPDKIQSEYRCVTCLRRPCECEDKSSEYATSKPMCSRCCQQPCACSRVPQLDEATQIAPPRENLPSHDFDLKLSLGTQPEIPKQSVTLLAYLARMLDNDDVLASLKQLERLPSADTTIAKIKEILNLLLQRSYDGKKIYTPGDEPSDDDREAVRILKAIVQSSRALTDHVFKFLCGVVEADAFAKGVHTGHDRIGGGSDLESSLLNSSPKHESIPPPLSDPVASAAAFLDSQLRAANCRFLQAINIPLAKYDSPCSPTPAPDSSVSRLEPCSKIEDASQTSSQKVIHPDSSAASASPKAVSRSGSPGGKISTVGAHPSMAEHSSESTIRNPLVSTTKLSEQVSHHLDTTEEGTDSIFGPPPMRHPHSISNYIANSDCELRPPSPPKPSARKLPENGSLPFKFNHEAIV